MGYELFKPEDLAGNAAINHYLISHGTFYEASEVTDDGLVTITGPDGFVETYVAKILLSALEKCGSTQEVRDVLLGETDDA